MGVMSDLDLRLWEAGIDPTSVTLEEAIDLLRCHDIDQEFAADCALCIDPNFGIIEYAEFEDGTAETFRCGHRCRLEMPEHVAAETLGLEDTEEVY